jgi:erythronate-4-phosphate dehydrogenase
LAAFLNLSLLPFAVPSSMAGSAEIICDGANELDFIKNTVAAVYDVMEDDKRFREIIGSSIRGQAFDLLRKHYPVRRELAYSALASTNPKFSAVLQALQSGR